MVSTSIAARLINANRWPCTPMRGLTLFTGDRRINMKLLWATALCLTVAACGNSGSGDSSNTSQPSQPNIPSYDLSSVHQLSKNERQELERRCLGVDHPTCTLLKSDSLKKLENLDRSFCEAEVAQNSITGGSLSPKCRDLLGRN